MLSQKTADLDKYVVQSTLEAKNLQKDLITITNTNQLLENDNRALLSTFE